MFEIIQHLTKFKTNWSKLSPTLQKDFSIFVANKFLATNFAQIEFVNELQKYTQLTDEQVYNIYLIKFPKYVQLNFVKKTKKELPKDLIQFVSKIKPICSKKELEQFVSSLNEIEFTQLCNNYQIDTKTIVKWKKLIL
jgi:Zn-dependent M32 family carboxypeptidase